MITEEKVEEILKKTILRQGIDKYEFIMNRVKLVDVSSDLEFQKTYRDFYQLRRFYSDEFATKYFTLMEQMKNMSTITFEMAFERVKHIQCTYEISFSSKLAHTLNPSLPVWDSVVTKNHFGINAPVVKKDKEQKIIERYQLYSERYCEYLRSDEGQMLIQKFDEAFPDREISDVKKIDFILWQDR